MTKGKLIVLEGMVGCGKTTQLEVVKRLLTERGVNFVYGREPGGEPDAERVRKLLLDADSNFVPLAQMYLFQAARAQYYVNIVRPQIESGVSVVTDRNYWSTETFQGKAGGVDLELIRTNNPAAVHGIHPDLGFILDVENVEAALIRARKTSQIAGEHDRFEDKELAYHINVRDGYREIPSRYRNAVLVQHFEDIADIPNRIDRISIYIALRLEEFLDLCKL